VRREENLCDDHLVFNWRDSVEWLANLAVLSSEDDESDDE
jgi:hypothetical protein